MEEKTKKRLRFLKIGSYGTIIGYAAPDPKNKVLGQFFDSCISRLIEMGLTKGTEVKVCHRAPFGGTPVAVEVHGNRVGLGKDECELILVESHPPEKGLN